jgi:hypothetical protein
MSFQMFKACLETLMFKMLPDSKSFPMGLSLFPLRLSVLCSITTSPPPLRKTA